MRVSMSRDALQKGKLEVLGVEHALGILAACAVVVAAAATPIASESRMVQSQNRTFRLRGLVRVEV